ncbi:hypothetical protein EG68_03670 [Paragonimus skrjabini miyazakii]|uniref:Hydrogen voltage-gated channel 1 n=1 Tax=Paragonimus skrjabini miyazakii TaxID=59628 RepID=A0A8S9Z7Z7_9TREM|nr:hypothetical protein EG68_03670 [Paragonimus skrjabini miyazakii]
MEEGLSGHKSSIGVQDCLLVSAEDSIVHGDKLVQVQKRDDQPSVPVVSTEGRTIQKVVGSLFHSKAFNLSIVVLCCLDGLLVVCTLLLEIEVLKLKPGTLRSNLVLTQFVLECASLAIVSLFLIEIPFKLWLFGFKFYAHHWLELVDAVVCIVSFTVDAYNIYRHTQHTSHAAHTATVANAAHGVEVNLTNSTEPLQPRESLPVAQSTLADAAGLLVLFRLWRVIRILNAIIISVTTSQDSTMRTLRAENSLRQERIKMLEELLMVNHIAIPSSYTTSSVPA